MTWKSNKLLKHTHTKNVSAKHFIDTEKGQSIWFHLHGIQKKEHYRTEVGCVVFRSWVLEREEMDFKGCGGVNNGPQIHPLPDPHNYEWYLVELKWLCKCHSGKDLELRRWPRIIGGGGGAPNNHKGASTRMQSSPSQKEGAVQWRMQILEGCSHEPRSKPVPEVSGSLMK